jgi:hypothetical protein
MRFRTFVPVVITLAAVAVAAACGGDGGSSSVTPTVTAGASASPTTPPTSPTATSSPQGTPPLLTTPGRSLPAATHIALGVFDAVNFFDQKLHGAVPSSESCDSYDATAGVIDCTSTGFGTIAVDPMPSGATDWQCHVLLTPDSQLFGANCIGTGKSFVYGIAD